MVISVAVPVNAVETNVPSELIKVVLREYVYGFAFCAVAPIKNIFDVLCVAPAVFFVSVNSALAGTLLPRIKVLSFTFPFTPSATRTFPFVNVPDFVKQAVAATCAPLLPTYKI